MQGILRTSLVLFQTRRKTAAEKHLESSNVDSVMKRRATAYMGTKSWILLGSIEPAGRMDALGNSDSDTFR